MHDQSCNTNTLAAIMRRGDFFGVPESARDMFRDATVEAACLAANSYFGGINPIKKFHLKHKTTYRIFHLANDLVVRKATVNLRRVAKYPKSDRSYVVKNLYLFLEEGVPYNVYRLDVKQFYESFDISEVRKQLDSLKNLAPHSKKVLSLIFDYYQANGGQGLPRGMALSADVSDFLMASFDDWVKTHPAVYYYGRYVDDILIITNQTENKEDFLNALHEALPAGLTFNKEKTIVRLAERINVQKEVVKGLKPEPVLKFSIDYLGYEFSVFDPTKSYVSKNGEGRRLVLTNIASRKVAKIKTRIVRAFLDFYKKNDKRLLLDRIKYLTSNFYIIDKRTGKRQLSGIYYAYPMLSKNCSSLDELDAFLRNAVSSKRGRLFSKTGPMIDSKLRRDLLSYSFKKGHESKRFIYFSLNRISEIQRCWVYE